MIKILVNIAVSIGVVFAMFGIKILDLPALITGVLVTALLIFFVYNLTNLSDTDEKKIDRVR